MLKQTKLIVLHRSPFGDSSLIVKGFSLHFGLISFLVKNAKGKNFPFKNSLAPLCESEVVFNDSGKSDLHFIREASVIEWFPELRKDLEKTAMAEVMAEILLRYLPAGIPQELEFRYTEKALKSLDRGPCPFEALARWLWHLADTSGYALSIGECAFCGTPITGFPADFLFESGGSVCKNCSAGPHYPPEFLQDIARLVSREPMQNPRAVENEFFKYIKAHLGEGREIKSIQWLQEVRHYAFGK